MGEKFKNFAIGVSTLFVSFAVVGGLRTTPKPAAASTSTPSAVYAAPPVSEGGGLDDIFLGSFSWSKGGFGSVMMADFTISNRNRYDVKDLTIYCQHSSGSGTVMDSNTRTVYERVRAGSTIMAHDVNMGFIHSQATRSGCKVTSFSRA